MTDFNHKDVEEKWQEKWEREGTFRPSEMASYDKDGKFYNLWMFPYPSAEGLHAGHAFASTGSDVYGRYERMNGREVFQPIGYDSFGIHSENFAIKLDEHPEKMLKRTTKNYERQLRSLGQGYDWTRTVTTSDVDYYKWTQWLFVQLFKAGLAYRRASLVNWCPSCKTVLADEQVIDGECERCSSEVEKRELKQWHFRITDYADALLEGLEKIDWPEKIKTAQRNWIGKSKGAIIDFKIVNKDEVIKSFTTRPDTLFGATFFVLAPEHPQVDDVTASKYKEKVQRYVDKALSMKKTERGTVDRKKEGVFTGGYVINPANGEEIPVYISDYVLMDYGTGAIMGVPGHDERDWEFARSNNLPIIEVIAGGNVDKEPYIGGGEIVNSNEWNGALVPEEIGKIIEDVEKRSWGRAETSYHLRDWIISRQRYWGPPIPMIYCQACARTGKSWFDLRSGLSLHDNQSDWEHAGWYPEENLPVKLPKIKDFEPEGEGKGPLENHPDFYKVECPECGSKAKRETDVSDTFLDSSWYFLRYPSVNKSSGSDEGSLPWSPEITNKWLPVDLYFGGAEHAVLHLLYSRFITRVLYDLKKISFDEPFPHFFAHGLMVKDGAKMSKSRGNVVNPDEYIDKFGADTLRLYLMFMGPMDGYPDFRDTGIEGMYRFLNRVWNLYESYKDIVLAEKDNRGVVIKMHQTIKKVTKDIENFSYNTAIAAIMEFVNLLRELATSEGVKRIGEDGVRSLEWDRSLTVLAKLIAPFAPHLAEEVWVNRLEKKFSVHKSSWPKFDPRVVKEVQITVAVQVNGKLRGTVDLDREVSMDKEKVISEAKSQENVTKWLEKKKIKDTIFVPGKLVNFVTG